MNNDPNEIPKEKLSELMEYNRRMRHPQVDRQRPGVHDSIRNARTTLLINLFIEIFSGIILLVGIGYTARFLLDRRAYLEPGKLRLYLEVLAFFTVGWMTYFGFKVRAKFLALKRHGKPRESRGNSPEP
ncbi:MAG: hypothetical protein ACYC9O_19615 [Candidatus Latescibacterota bacterium]